jgi:hypothetical protein
LVVRLQIVAVDVMKRVAAILARFIRTWFASQSVIGVQDLRYHELHEIITWMPPEGGRNRNYGGM